MAESEAGDLVSFLLRIAFAALFAGLFVWIVSLCWWLVLFAIAFYWLFDNTVITKVKR